MYRLAKGEGGSRLSSGPEGRTRNRVVNPDGQAARAAGWEKWQVQHGTRSRGAPMRNVKSFTNL